MGKHSRGKHRGKRSNNTGRLLLSLCIGSSFMLGLVGTASAPTPRPTAQDVLEQLTKSPTAPLVPTTPSLATSQLATQSATESPLPTTGPVEKDAPSTSSTTRSVPATTPPPAPAPSPRAAPATNTAVASNSKCNNLGVTDKVKRACNLIVTNVSSIGVIGGVGQRSNASCHPRGLALDLGASRVVGDAIALYALANKSSLGISSVIWRQRINFGTGWQPMSDRGGITANHYDHVHISFLPCTN